MQDKADTNYDTRSKQVKTDMVTAKKRRWGARGREAGGICQHRSILIPPTAPSHGDLLYAAFCSPKVAMTCFTVHMAGKGINGGGWEQ